MKQIMKIPQNECMNVVKSCLPNLFKILALGDEVLSRILEVWEVQDNIKICEVIGDRTQYLTTRMLEKKWEVWDSIPQPLGQTRE